MIGTSWLLRYTSFYYYYNYYYWQTEIWSEKKRWIWILASFLLSQIKINSERTWQKLPSSDSSADGPPTSDKCVGGWLLSRVFCTWCKVEINSDTRSSSRWLSDFGCCGSSTMQHSNTASSSQRGEYHKSGWCTKDWPTGFPRLWVFIMTDLKSHEIAEKIKSPKNC